MNSLFNAARRRLLRNQFNWEAPMPLLMCAFTQDANYTFDPSHITVAQVGTPAAVSLDITAPEATEGGYAKSSRAEFTTVPVGLPIIFLVLAEKIGATANLWNLIAYYDTGIGLPYVPNGLAFSVAPDWLAEQGWFRA